MAEDLVPTGSPETLDALAAMIEEYRQGRLTLERPRPEPAAPVRGRAPIAAVLLEDLKTGETGRARLLTATRNELHLVTILGEILEDGGSFKLSWGDGANNRSAPIAWDATPTEAAVAIADIDGIARSGIRVGLGNVVDADGSEHPLARWTVEFLEQLPDDDFPLLAPLEEFGTGDDAHLNGTVQILAETYNLQDAGDEVDVVDFLPVGSRSPLHRGAIVACDWFHTIGWGIVAAECRQFAETESTAS